jgi:hypothetical protein
MHKLTKQVRYTYMTTDNTSTIINILVTEFPGQTEFSPATVRNTVKESGYSSLFSDATLNKFTASHPKVARGIFDLSASVGGVASVVTPPKEKVIPQDTDSTVTLSNKEIASIANSVKTVPLVDSTYVSWGFAGDLVKLLRSKMFFTAFITGESGNGKSVMVEQSAAKLKLSIERVQISPETDEDDLVGGWALIDGETIFRKGPAIKAMEMGQPLFLDEIDRGTNAIMCLQGILEGKPFLIKKTGEVINPQPGFCVIATANTKGKGSDTGAFSAANVIDEAFLERFMVTFEQPYPSPAVEKRILMNHVDKYKAKLTDSKIDDLINWSGTIRDSYKNDAVDQVISTRRLCNIIQTFSVFNNMDKSIDYCISRFDTHTKDSFMDLYDKITPAEVNPAAADWDKVGAQYNNGSNN